MKNGQTKPALQPVQESAEEQSIQTTPAQLIDLSELLEHYVPKDQLKTLTEQMVNLQKTIDRQYEIQNELLGEQNGKIVEMRERVGEIEAKFIKFEIILINITNTFKDVGARLTRQTKEIEFTVKDSVAHEIKPVKKEVETLTTARPKVLHHVILNEKPRGFLRALRFWNRG